MRPSPLRRLPADPLLAPLLAGDRRALAQAITLIESTRSDHRERADALLAAVLPHTGKSVRLGITGVPGVGKSTLIERFGLSLLERGRSLAVLAIDPSSKRGGGSILGDKTRMEELSRHRGAFIRPSPAGATLGGVARRTREAMLLAEAAGFDTVIVETVGVGQSETAVADMVDMFIVLLLPAGGDDLQGIKRGVIELADLIVVNKADGDLKATARRSASTTSMRLRMLRSPTAGWTPEVTTSSAQTGEGVAEIWEVVQRFNAAVGERASPGAGPSRRAPGCGTRSARPCWPICAGTRTSESWSGAWSARSRPGGLPRRPRPGVCYRPSMAAKSILRRARRAAAEAQKEPFWKRKTLAQMTKQEWESLCDGCGMCCVNKLEYEGTGELAQTDTCCKLLDPKTARCKDYKNRKKIVPDCIQLTPKVVAKMDWLPKTCAYRLVHFRQDLYWWHPLLSGDPNTVHEAGISARGRVIPEDQVEDISDRVVDWFA